ncbi:MAG: hypothetical protein A3G87_08120 [Omnitrophica bacterium RIFCSPLOWO2_12_FULL_50_11]|nr:MAG: hypothetical protein A3G87_08120 [Omnitrophica bacterium RIFCSPLOWO2_12_FULL_50_11]
MAKKILVIDDDPDVREALKLRLEASGYHVVTATGGISGLKVFEETQPDLILLDVAMPDMDGYAFIKTFKAKYFGRYVPIIVLTGKDSMKDVFELEGARAYLTKPCDPGELVQTIQNLLRSR